MPDNRQMWAELGINLEKHDQLLAVLGPMYQDIYLAQKSRPKGMGFFDFVVGDIHGIRVHELQAHAKDGGKVVATYWSGRRGASRWDYAPGRRSPYPMPMKSCPGIPALS
jgi:hypothetical protein